MADEILLNEKAWEYRVFSDPIDGTAVVMTRKADAPLYYRLIAVFYDEERARDYAEHENGWRAGGTDKIEDDIISDDMAAPAAIAATAPPLPDARRAPQVPAPVMAKPATAEPKPAAPTKDWTKDDEERLLELAAMSGGKIDFERWAPLFRRTPKSLKLRLNKLRRENVYPELLVKAFGPGERIVGEDEPAALLAGISIDIAKTPQALTLWEMELEPPDPSDQRASADEKDADADLPDFQPPDFAARNEPVAAGNEMLAVGVSEEGTATDDATVAQEAPPATLADERDKLIDAIRKHPPVPADETAAEAALTPPQAAARSDAAVNGTFPGSWNPTTTVTVPDTIYDAVQWRKMQGDRIVHNDADHTYTVNDKPVSPAEFVRRTNAMRKAGGVREFKIALEESA